MKINENLPAYCYAVHPIDEDVIRIVAGEKGYFPCHYQSHGDQSPQNVADDLNAGRGISKAQVEAMIAGSMFGWGVPGADPSHYDANGRFISKGVI
jgi:hypothetical protein